ncbi:hypothetical protein GUJ93_ZPchr0012g21376 [Zizania palustris]|uniref:Uncharacterized protein n=1 Tax=Zizania palustris TaxID=103762 RepID=A0A8J5WR47_ZIZPA|nr:hypothetical protein GUJ93_ZPchr0012g21376 [Zizania palustris]
MLPPRRALLASYLRLRAFSFLVLDQTPTTPRVPVVASISSSLPTPRAGVASAILSILEPGQLLRDGPVGNPPSVQSITVSIVGLRNEMMVEDWRWTFISSITKQKIPFLKPNILSKWKYAS